MKFEIKSTNTNTDFKPIGLNLVIETKEELIDLVMRLNIAASKVNEHGYLRNGDKAGNHFYKILLKLQAEYEKLF